MRQTFTIRGEVPAKKNLQRAFVVGTHVAIRKHERVVSYEELVWGEVKQQGVKRMEGNLKLDLTVHYFRNRDVDGSLTTIMDALQDAGVYDNDSQIIEAHVRKLKVTPGMSPQVRIQLEALPAGYN